MTTGSEVAAIRSPRSRRNAYANSASSEGGRWPASTATSHRAGRKYGRNSSGSCRTPLVSAYPLGLPTRP